VSLLCVLGICNSPDARVTDQSAVYLPHGPDSIRYAAADRAAEYCDERVCVCVCVCLSAIISSELHVRSSQKFLYMLAVTLARSFSVGVVIHYIISVLWITS